MGCRHGWDGWHGCDPCDDWPYDRARPRYASWYGGVDRRGPARPDERPGSIEERLDALRDEVRRLETELASARGQR